MQSEPLIEFRDLSLSYGNDLILSHVNFNIENGDYIFFLGKNGSGKSTLVKSIFDDKVHQSGEIIKSSFLKDDSYISYVPQFSHVNNELPITVEEFIELGKINSNSSYTVNDVLDMVSMTSYKKSCIWSLSGGQRQRVLLARAFVRDASLYIFDEPTNGVDINSKADFYDLIEEFSREKLVSKIVVTHDVSMAIKYGQKLVLFNEKGVKVSRVDSKLKEQFSEMIHMENKLFKGLHDA